MQRLESIKDDDGARQRTIKKLATNEALLEEYLAAKLHVHDKLGYYNAMEDFFATPAGRDLLKRQQAAPQRSPQFIGIRWLCWPLPAPVSDIFRICWSFIRLILGFVVVTAWFLIILLFLSRFTRMMVENMIYARRK